MIKFKSTIIPIYYTPTILSLLKYLNVCLPYSSYQIISVVKALSTNLHCTQELIAPSFVSLRAMAADMGLYVVFTNTIL